MTEMLILDLSGNNSPNIDFAQVKAWADAYGKRIAVWCKATEGVNYVDPHFRAYVKAALAADIQVGAYHYLRIRAGKQQDADQQAEQFIAQMRAAGCNLPPMFDVEGMENLTDGQGNKLNPQPSEQESELAVRIFGTVTNYMTGRLPVLYTDAGEWDAFGLQTVTDFRAFDLWIANTTPNLQTPSVPSPWPPGSWKLWQYSWAGQIPGITGNVDLSRFNGTPADFDSWASGDSFWKTLFHGGLAFGAGMGLYKLWNALGRR